MGHEVQSRDEKARCQEVGMPQRSVGFWHIIMGI